MGDRANIAIHFDKTPEGVNRRVFLYSHWDGSGIALHLRDACKAGKRLDDAQYFARIVFDRMIGKRQGSEGGYGLSPFMCDNGYRILVADCDNGRVWVEEESGAVVPGAAWSMEEFGNLSDAEACAAMAH